MKKILIFGGGFVSGVITILVFPFLCIQILSLTRPETPRNLDTEVVHHVYAGKSIQVDYDRPIFLTDASGAEFRVDFQPHPDGRVDYTWRAVANPEQRGSGTVYEKYKVAGKTADTREAKDIGSPLKIDIEDLQIKWSSGGKFSGWIYFHPDELTVSTTPKGEQAVDRGA